MLGMEYVCMQRGKILNVMSTGHSEAKLQDV